MSNDRARPLLLVIDHDAAARAVVVASLGDAFEIFEAPDAGQAALLFTKLQPDAVVLGTMVAAAEMCARLRALPGGADGAIVVLSTADDEDAAIDAAYGAGATEI